MTKIIRTPTRAEGGITESEKEKLKAHSQKWIDRIMYTGHIQPEKITEAIKGLYRISKLEEPIVVVVPSPLVASLASGLAAAVWELRAKNKATSAVTYAVTYAETYDATYDATSAATRVATDAATRAATYEATDAATRAATYEATDAATYEATYDAIRDVTSAATSAATRVVTDATIRVVTDATIRAVTDATTRAATDAATFAATYEATREATREATSAVYNATDAATRAATFAATEKPDQLLQLVKKFTPDTIKNIWDIRQGGNMWAQYDSYLTACRDILGLTGLDCWEKYKFWEEAAIHGGYRFMHQKFCIVSDFPEILKVNDQNLPHSETGPSHRWRDGWEIYHLNGIRMEKALWQKIISGKMTLSEIMQIENVEQRTQALAYNPMALIHSGAKLVHKSETTSNELYCLADTEINELTELPKMYFLKFIDPSKPEGQNIMAEDVDPQVAELTPNADVCQAYAFGLSYDEYMAQKIER